MQTFVVQNDYVQSYLEYLTNLQQASSHATNNEVDIDAKSRLVKASKISQVAQLI